MENQMRRWLLLGTLGAVSALYLGMLEPKSVDRLVPGAGTLRVAEQRPEPKAVTIDDTVQAMLPMLRRADTDAWRAALEAIDDALDGAPKDALTAETREQAAQAAVAAFASIPGDTPEGVELKKQALQLVVSRLGGDAGRAFAAELLGAATDTWKLDVLEAWLKPGAVNGRVIREKAAELARTAAVPEELKPAILRRALGKKAEPELAAFLAAATDRRAVAACAVELQNLGKPEVLGPVLAKLEGAGLLDDHKKMPWLSGKLLAEHIRQADDAGLKRALKAVYLRPALAKRAVKAVQERAGHPDPEVRRLVARIIPDAVKSEGLDVQSGEELLLARLKEETDPAVKGEIEGSLAEVRKTRPAPKAAPETPAEP